MKKPYKTLSSRIAWSCPWYSVRQDEIELPNGETGVYNTVVKEAAVWIVPVTPEGSIIMLRQYRYTVDDWCWEIPAGTKKPEQTLEEAARAELQEETGGIAANLDYIGQFYLANGICNEIGHIFLATGVQIGPTAHEPTEVITVHTFPVDELFRMARAGEITDGPSALALFLCEGQLRAIVPGNSARH